MSDPIQQFRAAIQAAGLTPPHSLIPGKFHRFAGFEKSSRNRSAWAKLFADGRGGVFGDWSRGLSESWHAESLQTGTLTDDDRLRMRREIEDAKREAHNVQEADYAEAREYAARIWSESKPCIEHPYLTYKCIKPHGVRMHDGKLVVPVRDASGVLHSVQRIAGDGTKLFLPGGRVTSGHFMIGMPEMVLCLCEGFATAASIHESTGYPVAAAFSAGNLLPVARAMRKKFPRVRLILCADDDPNKIGEIKAREAADAVGGDLVLPDFGADRPRDVSDFNDLHCLQGLDAIRTQIQAVVSNKLSVLTLEPEPLRRPLPAAESYPLAALGDVLGDAAKAIASTLQAPPALIGQSLLAAASLAVQHLADVEVDGRIEPLSLWCMSIAASGERKSAVDTLALREHREYEREQLEAYKRDKQSHEISLQAYEAASRAATKGKDPDAIESRLHAVGAPPEAPLKPLLLMGSPTLEGLHKQFIGGLPSLGLFHDDAGEFLGGHSMNNENKTKTVAGLSRLWDAGEFDRVRASDGAEKHYGKRLALSMMMQPVIAETILSDEVLTGQGFLARCLLTWPKSTIGTRQYVERDLTKDPAMLRYWSRIRHQLSIKPGLREGSRNELEARKLKLTQEAKKRWRDVYAAIEFEMGDAGAFSSVRAWASKAPAQVLRMAGVLSLVESLDVEEIQAEVIDRAAILVSHYLDEAVRIVGTNSVPVSVRNAEALLEWCHGQRITHLHSAGALQYGPQCIRSRQAFDAAVNELEKSGWVETVPGGAVVDGKQRRRVWAIHGAS